MHVPFLPADQPREYVPAKAKSVPAVAKYVPAVAKSMPRNHPVPAVAKYGLAVARPVSLPHADMAGSVAKSMPGERVGCLVVSVRLPPADVPAKATAETAAKATADAPAGAAAGTPAKPPLKAATGRRLPTAKSEARAKLPVAKPPVAKPPGSRSRSPDRVPSRIL